MLKIYFKPVANQLQTDYFQPYILRGYKLCETTKKPLFSPHVPKIGCGVLRFYRPVSGWRHVGGIDICTLGPQAG